MDSFKGRVASSILDPLEQHDIHVCLLPPNATDVLQPMDISVNKPGRSSKGADQVTGQPQRTNVEEVELENFQNYGTSIPLVALHVR